MLVFRRLLLPGILCLFGLSPVHAQQKSKVELLTSETMFSVVTAVDMCAHNNDASGPEDVRAHVLGLVAKAIEQSAEARSTSRELCQFYKEHQPPDPNRDLSQYVSLALNLGGPPDFKPKVKEADLPPDTTYVLGLVPLMARFYTAANLHQIWTGVQPQYNGMMESFNEPLSKMILQTDVYLKNPISGYLGREFVIYLEPMTGPGQVNARNYGDDYFLVTAPIDGQLPMDEVRHTYLHFVLDPLALKRPTAMKRLTPLLRTVQTAPMEDSFKRDITLLVTESLIRAIEARLLPGNKTADPKREKLVEDDMAEGFVLTHYFYESLVKFEQEPTGLKDAFPDFLYYLDEGREEKRAAGIKFVSRSQGEIVKGKIREQQNSLDLAERRIGEGDLNGAEKLAQEALARNGPDAPRACLILGQVAILNKDKETAVKYFEEALQTAKDPHWIAWSHIYLGRIYDVDQDRDLAVKHYEAALRAGDDAPATKDAAERGLKSPYQRRASTDENQ